MFVYFSVSQLVIQGLVDVHCGSLYSGHVSEIYLFAQNHIQSTVTRYRTYANKPRK